MTTWGLGTFIMKIVGQRLDPVTTVGFNIIGYLSVAIFLFSRMSFALTRYHLLAIPIGIMFVLGNLAFYRLASTTEITILVPLTALYIAIPVLLGVLVLGEPMTVRKGIAFLLAAGAIYLLSTT